MILKNKKRIIKVCLLGLFLASTSYGVSKADNIEVIKGDDRYETSLKVLDKIESSETIVLVDGKNQEKIINACNLASKYNAPVALVNSNKDEKVLNKIEELKVKKTIIVGNVAIENKINTEVEKIEKEGKELNKEVTDQLKNESDKAVVTENLADALSATSYSAKNKAPIYLVDKDVDDNTIEEINKNNNSEVLIVGGTINSNVDEKINNSKRIKGKDRYETSEKIATLTGSTKNIYADGRNFADAISAVSLLNIDNNMSVVLAKTEKDIDKNNKNIVVGGSLFENKDNIKNIDNKKATHKETIGEKIAKESYNYLGGRYVWGANKLGVAVDCSGFTSSLYKKYGINIPRTSREQRNAGKRIYHIKDAKPGDIVCFNGHVGIYVGEGKMIHASSPRTGIIKTSVSYGSKPLFYVRPFGA